MRTKTRPMIIILGFIVCVALVVFRVEVRSVIHSAVDLFRPRRADHRSVEDRVREYGEIVRRRLQPDFDRAKVPYPPRMVTIIGLKQEKTLEVYAAGTDGAFAFIRSYPIRAASGKLGPKLREGDLQVPEGLYRVENLNPNSLYHLALRVNYPNEFDRSQAAREQRENLGGDIMIHGKAASIGCLAMGDTAAEDLFVLAALTGIENIKIILSPLDFRVHDGTGVLPTAPEWLDGLYLQIQSELQRYPRTSLPRR